MLFGVALCDHHLLSGDCSQAVSVGTGWARSYFTGAIVFLHVIIYMCHACMHGLLQELLLILHYIEYVSVKNTKGC